MCLYRRSALWAGCAVLTLVFVAAEELADATDGITDADEAFILAEDSDISDMFAPEAEDEGDDDIDIDGADSSLQQMDADLSAGAAPASVAAPPAADSAGPVASPPAKAHTPKSVTRICRVTAYCDRGLTAAGIPSGVGQCAAPADIPLGSIVYVPSLNKKFMVTDRTHRRFRHNTVDLFMPSEKVCRNFGRHYLECEFTFPSQPARYGELRVALGG